MNPIEWLNGMAESWFIFMLDRVLGSTMTFLFALSIWYGLRKWITPQWGYVLFLLVFLKLIVPYQPFTLFSYNRSIASASTSADGAVANPTHLEKSGSEKDHWILPPITIQNHKIVQTEEKSVQKPLKIDPITTNPVIADPVIIESDKAERDVREVARSNQGQSVSGVSVSLQTWLMIGWLVIVFCLGTKILLQFVRIHRLIQQTDSLDQSTFPFDFRCLSRKAGVKHPVRVRTAGWVTSPFAAGILRPSILIPAHLLESQQTAEIRWIFFHELTHIRRRDSLVKFIETLIQIVFFFHPVVWIAGKLVDRFREFACDDAAIHGSESSRSECGEGFLRIVLMANNPIPALPGTVTLFHSKKIIKERLMRILNHRPDKPKKYLVITAFLFLILALGTIPFGVIANQTNPQIEFDDEISITNPMPRPAPQVRVESHEMNFDFDIDIDIDHVYDQIAMSDFDMDLEETPNRGVWTAQIREGELRMDHTFQTEKGRSNFGDTHENYKQKFRGLSQVNESSTFEDIQFELDSDAGTISYTGDFKEGMGAGHFLFEPKEEFIHQLKRHGLEGEIKHHHLFLFTVHSFRLSDLDELAELGYDDLAFDQLMKICLFDIQPDYIRGLRRLGLTDLPFKQIVAMCIHGVSLESIREFRKAGFSDLQADDFIKLRIHNVTLEYAKEMEELGFGKLSLKELIDSRISNITPKFIKSLSDLGYSGLTLSQYKKMGLHGVKPDYIKEMTRLGYENLSADELVDMRIHNVKPDYIEELAALGYKNLSVDQIMKMGVHNVKPEFIKKLTKHGYTDLSPSQLVDLKIHNFYPEVAEELNRLGYDGLSFDLLKKICIHNVSPDYMRDFSALGYDDIPLEQFIEMRIHNVRSNFVRELRKLGYKDLPVKDLIKLRIHNIEIDDIQMQNEKENKKLSVNELVNRKIRGN